MMHFAVVRLPQSTVMLRPVMIKDDLLIQVFDLHRVSRRSRDRVIQTLDQGVDFGGSRVQVEGSPGRRLHAEALMQRPGAVMAGPHRDTSRVQQMAYVVWVDRLPVGTAERERDGAASIHWLVRSEDRHPGQAP